ncbi:hypothetical protein ABK046_47380, partial [Streptomyces caeruleatus]
KEGRNSSEIRIPKAKKKKGQKMKIQIPRKRIPKTNYKGEKQDIQNSKTRIPLPIILNKRKKDKNSEVQESQAWFSP